MSDTSTAAVEKLMQHIEANGWTWVADVPGFVGEVHPNGGKATVCEIPRAYTAHARDVQAFIAIAPRLVRALLAERDELREAVETHLLTIRVLDHQLPAALAERDAALQEKDSLRLERDAVEAARIAGNTELLQQLAAALEERDRLRAALEGK